MSASVLPYLNLSALFAEIFLAYIPESDTNLWNRGLKTKETKERHIYFYAHFWIPVAPWCMQESVQTLVQIPLGFDNHGAKWLLVNSHRYFSVGLTSVVTSTLINIFNIDWIKSQNTFRTSVQKQKQWDWGGHFFKSASSSSRIIPGVVFVVKIFSLLSTQQVSDTRTPRYYQQTYLLKQLSLNEKVRQVFQVSEFRLAMSLKTPGRVRSPLFSFPLFFPLQLQIWECNPNAHSFLRPLFYVWSRNIGYKW